MVITAGRDAVEEIVLDCAEAGVGGVIIFASGCAETGLPDRVSAQERLAAIARETGLRIIGSNCIGVVNAAVDSRITFINITTIPPPRPHAVGIISQSGALGMALAQAVDGGRRALDPLFGPLVVGGLGGILVEVLQDAALAPAPVTHAVAHAMLQQLKGARLLRGFRGAPAVDLDPLADAIHRISRFAAGHRDSIAELDVNPLICAGERIVAVDALIVPKPR